MSTTSRESSTTQSEIFERGSERPLQRIADRMVGDIQRRRARQAAARRQPLVEQQQRPQLPRRPLLGMRRDRKAHRPQQMRRDAQQHIAFPEGPTDAEELPPLQPGQIAMDQPRRGLRRAGAEIALLQQDHAQAAAGRITRNARAVQATADDRDVTVRHAQRLSHFNANEIRVRGKEVRQGRGSKARRD
ncbi:hypothetical protein ACVWY2_007769 [Bradyrhizobium sp. JR6.1]